MLLITAMGFTSYMLHRPIQNNIHQNVIVRKQIYVALAAYTAQE